MGKMNPEQHKRMYMLKSVRKHTCIGVESSEAKRSANFPLASEDLIKYIWTTVFKDPRIPITQLLNLLEDHLGSLFAEENRTACGSKAAAYNTVYEAREMIREKFCGTASNADYSILPMLKNIWKGLTLKMK